MKRVARIVGIVLGAGALLGLAGFALWIFLLPPAPAVAAPPPIAAEETAATLAALKPPKRARPLIAVIGINDATETTDYLLPAGILRRSGVADVAMLATGPGPVRLYPALAVQPDATIAAFDAKHPEGADYIIVPAMRRDDDPAALAWIRAQAAKGATVISVCAGAKVLAETGLLDGKRATTHWYYRKEMLKRHPSIRYVPDRRMVIDGRVVTTTGITASIPTTLMLIEAIAGADKARAVARDLGVASWDARHASAGFTFNRPFALTAMGNTLAFWNRERLGIALAPGIDELSLVLVADAWSRTYRSRAITFAPTAAPVTSRGGMRILPDTAAARWPATRTVPDAVALPPVPALDRTLAAIDTRYGPSTANLVAMQLEYPRPNAAPAPER